MKKKLKIPAGRATNEDKITSGGEKSLEDKLAESEDKLLRSLAEIEKSEKDSRNKRCF